MNAQDRTFEPAAESAVQYLFKRSNQNKNVNYLTHLEDCIKLGQMRLDHDPECMTTEERRRFEKLKTEFERAVIGAEIVLGYRHSSSQVASESQDGQDVLWR